ncbi:type IV conjugative transfer system protein TraL [Halomonas sp. DP5N14-9]|uniref:type IV conjugative transfer system protein TraL n=1 Tax=Halomonas sp. DP5N14-9 TaxID=2859075 RepID=UPI001C99EB2B|nr:type IV conjugative transfer system protein TraL [Halomonas sp. DP5N14-9]MBY5940571.1 type IV conjugative transfer system protein TraL [Halomonas sp. DP5N14-9]
MEPVRIPSRIDDPIHVLMWSLDEMAPIFAGLILGIAVGQAMIGFGIGLVVTNQYRKYRDNHPDGYLIHIGYWAGLLFTNARSMVNPFIRRFLP